MGQRRQHLFGREVAHGLDSNIFLFGGRADLRHSGKVQRVVRDVDEFQGRRSSHGLGEGRAGVVPECVIFRQDESFQGGLPQTPGELRDTDVIQAALGQVQRF